MLASRGCTAVIVVIVAFNDDFTSTHARTVESVITGQVRKNKVATRDAHGTRYIAWKREATGAPSKTTIISDRPASTATPTPTAVIPQQPTISTAAKATMTKQPARREQTTTTISNTTTNLPNNKSNKQIQVAYGTTAAAGVLPGKAEGKTSKRNLEAEEVCTPQL